MPIMGPFDTMLKAWRDASLDLDFQFVAPFVLRNARHEVNAFGHVPEFGSHMGMVIFTTFIAENCHFAESLGFGYSCISISDETYDRTSFIDLLNDWGWCSRNRNPRRGIQENQGQFSRTGQR